MVFSSIIASPIKRLQLFTGLFLAFVLASSHAQAQQEPQYKEMPAPAEAKTWSKVSTYAGRKDVEDMLRGNSALDPVAFDRFFLQIMFPHFTRSENFQNFATRTDLPKMRKTCKEYLNMAAKNPQAHQRLNEKTLQFMDEVAQDTYDPAARANAMLMIGDLNETDPNGKPLKNALPALLKGVTPPTTIDAVRVPALRGLVRQAQAGIDTEARPQVLAAMLAVLAQNTPPADRTVEGNDWIRRRAIDVLSAMGEPGENGAVAEALQKVIDDSAASVSMRSAAAAALANAKLTPPPGLDAQKLAKSIGGVAVEAYKNELAQSASQFKPIAAERLKQHLAEIHRGLVGDSGKGGVLAMAKAAPVQQYIGALAKEIENLQTACNTAVLTQPIPPGANSATSPTPVIPIDTQEPLAKAITQAGGNVEAALQRAAGAAPAENAGAAVPPG